jgi:Tfp pilus assembly protein PilF
VKPSQIADYLARAAALQQLERYDPALAELSHVLAHDPANVAAHALRARILCAQKRFTEAEAAARAALAANPQTATAHHALACVLWSERLLEAAEQAFRRMLACPPTANDALLHTDYVLLLLEQHRLDAALALADRIQAAAPQLSAAHEVRGAVLADQDQDDEARAAYRQALQLDPRNFSAMRRLGRLEMKTGHPAAARDLFRTVLQLRPDDASTQADLALALRAQVPLYGRLQKWGARYQRRLIVAFVVVVWLSVVLPGLLSGLAGRNTPASAAIQSAWPFVVGGIILLGLLTPVVWELLPPLINTLLRRDPLARQVLNYDPMDPVRAGLLLALIGSLATAALAALLWGLGSAAFGAASGCFIVSVLALVLVPSGGRDHLPAALRLLRYSYGLLVVSAYGYMLLLLFSWSLPQTLTGVAFIAGLVIYGVARLWLGRQPES